MDSGSGVGQAFSRTLKEKKDFAELRRGGKGGVFISAGAGTAQPKVGQLERHMQSALGPGRSLVQLGAGRDL